jgi:hypothetical protein
MRNPSRPKGSQRSGGPQKLGDLLANLISRRGYAQQQVNEEISNAWTHIIGRGLSENSRTGRVRRGVLEILVNNSVALQELQFEKRLFLKHMNQALPQHGIQDLRFRIVGEIS